jgi:hypothetical protein
MEEFNHEQKKGSGSGDREAPKVYKQQVRVVCGYLRLIEPLPKLG